jgi:hypothetical protein
MLTLTNSAPPAAPPPAAAAAAGAFSSVAVTGAGLVFAALLLLDCWKQLFLYDLTGGHPTT